MKYICLPILCLFLLSCGNEKIVQLPEIAQSEITEIRDVSPAYIFYDETKTDSVELNRKNLISTTNWLVNVDKRLSLKQAIPKIRFIQNKKRNAELHKNENAKNYYTCNNTSIKNLGFIEFTDVVYKDVKRERINSELVHKNNAIALEFHPNNTIQIDSVSTSKDSLFEILKLTDLTPKTIYLCFDQGLSFQEYITYKSMLEQLDLQQATIAVEEFVFN